MSSELTVKAVAQYAKGNAAFTRTITKTLDVSGTAVTHAVQNVGTAEEQLALGDVTPSGYAIFYNLDATNYVQLGKATGVYVLRLKAGEVAMLRLEAWTTIYAKANTGAVDLEYYLLAD